MAAEYGGWRVCANSNSENDREESAERHEDVPRAGLTRGKKGWKEIARNEQKFLLLHCGFGKK